MGCPSFLRYVRAVLAFHLATLMVSFAILLAVTIRIDSGGPYVDEQITPVIARAIIRQDDGQLVVRITPELAELRETTDDLWFVFEDDAGRSVTFGQGEWPPTESASPGGITSLINQEIALKYSRCRGGCDDY